MCYYSSDSATVAQIKNMFPTTQAELIRAARAERSQAEFARMLGVDRTCLSRYEREILGAPPSVISHCLMEIGRREGDAAAGSQPVDVALRHAREVVSVLEGLQVLSAADRGRGNLPISEAGK